MRDHLCNSHKVISSDLNYFAFENMFLASKRRVARFMGPWGSLDKRAPQQPPCWAGLVVLPGPLRVSRCIQPFTVSCLEGERTGTNKQRMEHRQKVPSVALPPCGAVRDEAPVHLRTHWISNRRWERGEGGMGWLSGPNPTWKQRPDGLQSLSEAEDVNLRHD